MQTTNAILLMYYHPPAAYAPTVMDSVNSFTKYSQFKVYPVNPNLGYPKALDDLQFKVIALHYSMFGSATYVISPPYYKLLERHTDAHKIWICQDECYNFKQRQQFANRYKISCIYSCLKPRYFDEVYLSRCPSVKKVIPTLTGYVSESMVKNARKFAKEYKQRAVDVGYRARKVPSYLGLGGLEKVEIAEKFLKYANVAGLSLDIKCREEDRIYGDHYWRWLGNLRAILGVESGGSIFDLDNEVWDEYNRKLGKENSPVGDRVVGYEELAPEIVKRWENRIRYRAISPRCFEAAAFRICQIMYLGEYNNILQPNVHYLPLERDFANFHQVLKQLKNGKHLEVIDDAYRDLIESEKYSFQKFIEQFDEELIASGFNPTVSSEEAALLNRLLRQQQNSLKNRLERLLYAPYYNKYPGKKYLMPIAQPAGQLYFKLKGYKKGL